MTYTYSDGKSNIAVGASADETGAIAINGALIRVPVDHAPRIVEALTGRKVAILHDLPEVTENPDSRTDTCVVHAEPDPMTYAGYSVPTADEAWKQARNYAAIARHIEARDAAKEQERAEEGRRKAWADLWLAGPTAPEHSVNDWPEWLAKLGVEVPAELPSWQNRPEQDGERGHRTEGCHSDPIDRGLEAG